MARRKNGALQTVIVKQAVARTRKQAAKVVRKLGKRTHTSRFDRRLKAWRFRQRPPSCFEESSYGQKCFNKRGVKNGVCLVYARFGRGAKKRKSCR